MRKLCHTFLGLSPVEYLEHFTSLLFDIQQYVKIHKHTCIFLLESLTGAGDAFKCLILFDLQSKPKDTKMGKKKNPQNQQHFDFFAS